MNSLKHGLDRLYYKGRLKNTSRFDYVEAHKINVGLLFSALFGVFVLSGLFAFFISSRSWHWFVRATILIISVLPFLLVDASDLTLVLLVSQLSIFLAVQFEKVRQSQVIPSDDTGRLLFVPNFKLGDLLLVLVIICAISALISQAIRFSPLELVHIVGNGLSIGIWSLSSISLIYWKFPWRKKLGIGLFAMWVALIWAALDDQWFGVAIHFDGFVPWFAFLPTIAVFVLLMLTMYKYSTFSLASTDASPSRFVGGKLIPRVATGVLLIIGFCFVGSTMTCFVSLLTPPKLSQSSRRTVPGGPNGLAELVEAGLEFGNSPYLRTAIPINPGQLLRDEVAAYSKTFEKLDIAISRERHTCIDLSALDPDKDSFMDMAITDQVQSIREVARALSVKASQEIYDENYDEAIADGLRCIKACRCLNDCILHIHVAGLGFEGIGSHPIRLSIEYASTAKLKEAAQTLQEIDAETVPLEQVFANDDYYVWRLNDWKVWLFIRNLQMKYGSAQSESVIQVRAWRDAIRAQLRTAIALELYKHDHGCYPDKLAMLVPVYLNQVLDDPFSRDTPRKPLRFVLVNDEKYTLYSISANGVDEGGELKGRSWLDGDLNYAETVRRHEMEYRQEAENYAKLIENEPSNDQE